MSLASLPWTAGFGGIIGRGAFDFQSFKKERKKVGSSGGRKGGFISFVGRHEYILDFLRTMYFSARIIFTYFGRKERKKN